MCLCFPKKIQTLHFNKSDFHMRRVTEHHKAVHWSVNSASYVSYIHRKHVHVLERECNTEASVCFDSGENCVGHWRNICDNYVNVFTAYVTFYACRGGK